MVLRAVEAACERGSLAARGSEDDPASAAAREAFQHEVLSAIGEAVNNIVLHAYGETAPADALIEVEVDTSPEALTVRLFDTGESFDMADVPSPDLDALPEGGLGLFIMRAFVDELTYEPGRARRGPGARDERDGRNGGDAGAPKDAARNVMTLKKAWPSAEALVSSSVHRTALDAPVRGSSSTESSASSAATSGAAGPSNGRESGRSGWRIRKVSPAASPAHAEGRIAGIKRK